MGSLEDMVAAHRTLMAQADRLLLMATAPEATLPLARTVELLHQDARALRSALADHFAMEEAGGYLSDITDRRPNLARRASELEAQHGEILRGLDDAIEDQGEHIRRTLQRVLVLLSIHEAAENEFVQTTALEDLGEGD